MNCFNCFRTVLGQVDFKDISNWDGISTILLFSIASRFILMNVPQWLVYVCSLELVIPHLCIDFNIFWEYNIKFIFLWSHDIRFWFQRFSMLMIYEVIEVTIKLWEMVSSGTTTTTHSNSIIKPPFTQQQTTITISQPQLAKHNSHPRVVCHRPCWRFTNRVIINLQAIT